MGKKHRVARGDGEVQELQVAPDWMSRVLWLGSTITYTC